MASGSIHKHTAKDGRVSWRVRVDIVDPQSGKRRQPQKTFSSKREAEKGLREWLHEIDAGQAVSTTKRTLADYMSWWLEHCAAHRVKPSTLASYRYLTTTYIIPALGAGRLDRLSPQRIQTFYSQALTRRAACGVRRAAAEGDLAPGARRLSPEKEGLSHRTVRYLHSILHSALREAVRLQMLARNPTDAVTPPRAVRQEARAWSPEEAQRFLAVAQGDGLWPLWLLALHTGLRKSELLGLRWRDIDLDGGVLTVRQSVVRVGNALRIQEGAKRGGHTLLLDSVCVAALREHRTRQLQMRLLLGPLWTDHDLVIADSDGGPLHPTTIGRHFDALKAQAGVSPLSFHGLRHTHATILMLHGVHPKVVSERLGHADIGITLRTYSHVLPQMHQQAAEVFAAAVNSTEERG